MSLVDYFLKVDGVDGESKDNQFPKHIELLSWSMGGQNTRGVGHSAAGGGTGKVSIHDFRISAFTSTASPTLFKFCCIGQKISTVELFVRKAGDTPQVYMKIKLTDVMVSSYNLSGKLHEDKNGRLHTVDEVSFNFAKIDVAYGQPDEKGKVNALDKKMTHDLRTDK